MPETTERRRQEAEAVLERFVGRTITPEVQAEVTALLLPLQQSWNVEDANDVVAN